MSDYLAAIAAHLNAEPSMCICGHPSVLHADGHGCMARFTHDSGSDACPCKRAFATRPPTTGRGREEG